MLGLNTWSKAPILRECSIDQENALLVRTCSFWWENAHLMRMFHFVKEVILVRECFLGWRMFSCRTKVMSWMCCSIWLMRSRHQKALSCIKKHCYASDSVVRKEKALLDIRKHYQEGASVAWNEKVIHAYRMCPMHSKSAPRCMTGGHVHSLMVKVTISNYMAICDWVIPFRA